jgi:hypothetical protein
MHPCTLKRHALDLTDHDGFENVQTSQREDAHLPEDTSPRLSILQLTIIRMGVFFKVGTTFGSPLWRSRPYIRQMHQAKRCFVSLYTYIVTSGLKGPKQYL